MSYSTITASDSIAAFNRGPLVSVFTPPAACLSTLTYAQVMYFGHWGSNFFDSSCFPVTTKAISQTSNFQASSSQTSNSWDLYYYSPGQCPSGWSHAATISSYFGSVDNVVLSLGSDTTAVVCCPSGYVNPTNGNGHQCFSTVLGSTTLTYNTPSTVDNTLVRGTPQVTSISTGTYYISGDGIPVWWQSSDLAAFTATSSASSSAPANTTSSLTTLETPTPTPSPTGGAPLVSDSPTPSSGLSTGAKAAIGVCVPLVFIAILLGIFCFICFRRRSAIRTHASGNQQGNPAELWAKVAPAEMYSNQIPNNPRTDYNEEPQDNPAELRTNPPQVVMYSNQGPNDPRTGYNEPASNVYR